MATDAESRAAERAAEGQARQQNDWPSKIGKYDLLKKLGAGGMGTVFLAQDTQLRRKVAIKLLPREKAENPILVRRFQAEAQAAAQLRHDNIVAVYDSGEADGFLYIAMEYVDGQDLYEMVQRRGTIPVKRSIEIIKQVASALQHAHELKIVHRDIKPSNLLIRRLDKAVKLTDLGLARSIDDTIETGITRAGTTVGTVDYMAPEQARNSKAADIRSDLYSLGCTWYHMLTGSPPYPEGSLTNKLQAHAIKPLPDPRTVNPNVTEGLVAVIHRLMAKKPEDRYQTPAELLKDLEESTLTRAAFSQEILNAIQDESGHAVPAANDDAPTERSGRHERITRGEHAEHATAGQEASASNPSKSTSSKGKRGAANLPPPMRRKVADLPDERPPSPVAERMKMVIVIAGIIAAIAGLGWLISGVGGVFDSQANLVVVPEQNQLEPGAAAVAVQPAVAAPVPGQNPGAPQVAPMVAPVAPGAVVNNSQGAPLTVGTASLNPGVAATSGTQSGTGTAAVGSSNSSPQAVISSQAIAGIRPSVLDQKPTAATRTSLPNSGGNYSVGAGAVSPTHFQTLNDALLKLPPEGGVVRLMGAGPYSLSLSVPLNVQQLMLLGDPKTPSLVVLSHDATGQLGHLEVTGDLELSHIHFVLDSEAQPVTTPASMVQAQGPSVLIQDCSFTVLGFQAKALTAITFDHQFSPQTASLFRTAIRGEMDAAFDLRSPAFHITLNDSLVACGSGTAIRFAGPSGSTPAGETSRWLRSFGSTFCSDYRLIDFSREAGHTQHPGTAIFMRDVVGSCSRSDASSVLLAVSDWLQPDVRETISWSNNNSSFLGFSELIDFGSKSSSHFQSADAWRQFWRQKAEPHEFLQQPWPAKIEELGLASAAVFDRDSLPVEVRNAAQNNLPGISAEWIHLPELLHPERLRALASRLPLSLPRWTIAKDGPIRVDIRKEDLGQFLSKNEWPDGAVVEAVGYGLCSTSPVTIQGKKLKLIFRQAEGGPLRLSPKDAPKETRAVFEVRNGLLEIDGLKWEHSDARPRHPAWVIHAVNSGVIVRNCDFRGLEERQLSYAGVLRLEATSEATPQQTYLGVLNSVLIGAGPLIQTQAETGRLYLRNCVLAAQGTAIETHLQPATKATSLAVDIADCTLAATQQVFHVHPGASQGSAKTASRWYLDRNAFVPPGPWKTVASADPVIVRCPLPVVDQKQMSWWGQSNGIAKEYRTWVAVDGAVPLRTVRTAKEWDETWGEGHDQRLLTGADGVVLAGPYPNRVSGASIEMFSLLPTSKSGTWADGRAIGVDLTRLASIGPRELPKATPAGNSTKKPGAKSPTPLKPGF